MKRAIALAALAAIGFAGAAYAGDAGPKPMSDSEMDRVTAAGGPPGEPGFGLITGGLTGSNFPAQGNPPGISGADANTPGGTVTRGRCTAGLAACP